MNIALQRCFNHTGREAAALCTHCSRHFCRECVTEHDGRVACASCLADMVEVKKTRRVNVTLIMSTLCIPLCFLLVWALFYWLGEVLLAIPSSFHEGDLWSQGR